MTYDFTGRMTYHFTIILTGVSELLGAMSHAPCEAGCDDATVSSSGGVVSIRFARGACSLGHAIGSAVASIERAGFVPRRIEIDVDGESTP